ncbi:MAG: hypothetical protein DDT33_00695 [Firmicutes bacterium]|nr:hypothetical protein [Bacillota bacterium]
MVLRMMKLISVIDTISIWSGKGVSLLLLLLIGIITYEVVARYLFNAPTLWAHESMVYTAGTIYIIGGAFTHQRRGHVAVDCIYNLFSPRGKALVDTFLFFPIYLLFLSCLIWIGGVVAWGSIMISESSGSLWNPPIYPIRSLIPLGASLLLLQGLSKLIGDVKTIITGKV